MATVKKSIRIDQETAERVSSIKAEGESEAAAYNRVICAGLDAIGCIGNHAGADGDTAAQEAADTGAGNSEHIADLRATITDLRKQMEAKDRQIERTQELAAQAHRLHAEEQKRAAALALPEPKKGLGQRIREFFKGETN